MEHFVEIEGPKHLCLRQDCGACGHAINLDEQIVTLIKDTTSSPPKARGPFKFPDYGYDANGQSPKGWLLCRFPSCERCATGPETATLHVDCFNLYNKEMSADDKMERLFTAATWRYPWKNVPAMKLEPSFDLDGGRSLDLAAEICGMPDLLNLPFELAEMVRDFARPSTLWRFASVLNLVESLSAEPFGIMESIPLSDISSWERGSVPTLSPASSNDPIIRLTVDSRGLRMIERLPEMPKPADFRTDSFAFVVEHEQVFKGVTADFNLGFGHLNMPEGPSQLKLWDRPSPPPLEESLIYHTPVARKSLSLNTVDMDSCSGLTFFMTSKDTFAIHAHTRARPTAHSTFETLSPRHQDVAAWVYVPFAPSDRVEGFGVRRSVTDGGHLLNNPAYLFRTALAGDFSVGSDEKRRSRTIFTHTGPGTKLVHNVAEGKPLSLIGAYPQNREQLAGIDASQLTPLATPRVGRGCFSSADLKDATHLSVFEDAVTRACKGVIIEYANGAQRAIGQCRVGDDSVVEYHHPEKICIAPVGDRKQSSKWGFGEARVIGVSSSSPLSNTDDNLLWRSFDLCGEMQFWFDRNVSQILVV